MKYKGSQGPREGKFPGSTCKVLAVCMVSKGCEGRQQGKQVGRVQGINGHAGGTAVRMKVRNTPALT